MATDQFDAPVGPLTLIRPGQGERSPLQAWDAADTLALAHLAEAGSAVSRCLVVNDAFGALALGLASSGPAADEMAVWSWSDSAVAHAARRVNAEANGIDPAVVVGLRTVDELPSALAGSVPEVVIVKIPKSLALLEHQLCALSGVVGSETVVIGAAMTRHIHTSTIELFERILGPTRTTRAKRKARLILTEVDAGRAPTPVPDPTSFVADAATVADGTAQPLTVWNHAGVFSQKRLDIGTRFLLQSLPALEGPVRVVDLGCGNGVVGAVIARRNPEVEVVFVDESALAIDSARRTWAAASLDAGAAPGAAQPTFLHADATSGALDLVGEADVVVLNPPFHDHQAIAVEAGRALIGAARELLVPGGQLFVVANRHVAHHVTMRRIFGRCDVVASNPKFVVMESRTRAG